MKKWNSIKIEDFCDTANTFVQTGPFGSQLHESDYSVNGIPVIMPKDIVNGKVSEKSIARVSENHVQRLKRHKVIPGDIIYGRRGDIGRHAIISSIEKGWLCGTGCLLIRLNKNRINSKYNHYYLSQQSVIDYVANQAIGATMPNLNTTILKKISIPLAPFSIQLKIAAILSTYDDLIENNNHRIAILEKMAEELYREWFVRLRFPGHEKVKIVKGVPEGWEVRKITEIDEFEFLSNNITSFIDQKRYYATADVDGITVLSSSEIITYNNRPSRAQNQPELHTVWFARMKNTYKILFFSEGNHNLLNQMIFSTGFVGFKTNKNLFPFLLLTIKSNWFHEIKDMYSTGATQESLTNNGLKKIKILLPNRNILVKYGRYIYPIIEKIHQLQISSKLLATSRDRLLSRLISGKIDVDQLDIQFPASMQKEATGSA